MADQSTELRRINWLECFPFTNIFKTFRIAISPTKLLLALVALILTGLVGYVLDGIWSSKCQPVYNEVTAYWQVPNIRKWHDQTLKEQAEAFGRLRAEMRGTPKDKVAKAEAEKEFESNPAKAVNSALDGLEDQYAKATEKLGRGKEDRRQIAETATEMNRIHADLERLRPQGVFKSFLTYETTCIRQMMDSARVLNFTGWLSPVINSRSGGLEAIELPGGPDPSVLDPAEVAKAIGPAQTTQTALKVPSVKAGGPHGIGVLPSIFLMLRGFQWLFATHWFFALLFLLSSLAIWSWLGGAICRIAALNFARDERISAKAALAFSCRKFLGFFTAPLLPVLMVVAIGVCLIIGGMFLAIPFIGELLGGLLMGLALLGGFVMALVIVGAAGGFGLMWPTIAVEGSDGFDAISRSYSYLYSRPWRTAFYAVVAVVYGSLCYLFARFFVLVVLKSTRLFVGWGAGLFGTHRPGVGTEGATKIDSIWAIPSFEHLYSPIPPFGTEHAESVGAFFISIWLMLLVGLLCAFLASFFLSGSTIVYYLLRKEVDATDLTDVFVEEEPQTAAGLPGAAAPAAPPATGPAPSAGSGEAPSGSPPPPPPSEMPG
jgi:hypothetical protein